MLFECTYHGLHHILAREMYSFQSKVNCHDVRKRLAGQEVTGFGREQLSEKELMSSQGELGSAVYLHEVCVDDSLSPSFFLCEARPFGFSLVIGCPAPAFSANKVQAE